MRVTKPQLDIQIDRLIETFGEKFFSSQRIVMIWDAVEGLEYASVISIVDEFISSAKHPPLPKDFSIAAKDYKRDLVSFSLGEHAPFESAKCLDCGDSGFVHIERKKEFEPWARAHSGSAPCHCNRGRGAIEAMKRLRRPVHLTRQFGPDWELSYKILPVYSAHTNKFTYMGQS